MDGVNGDNVHKYFFLGVGGLKNRTVVIDPNTRNTRINASRIRELSRKSEGAQCNAKRASLRAINRRIIEASARHGKRRRRSRTKRRKLAGDSLAPCMQIGELIRELEHDSGRPSQKKMATPMSRIPKRNFGKSRN